MYYNLTKREESGIKSVLTVGDPIYEKEEKKQKIVPFLPPFQKSMMIPRGERNTARSGQLAYLPWSARETEWIKKTCNEANPQIPVVRLVEDAATKANVQNHVTGQSLFHFSGHGLIEEEYGNMYAALALTPANSNDDGFLELPEIFNLDLKACELTILSACDTNLGANQKGEGTWALSSGMLVAGSRRDNELESNG